jgi:hypothetical protein
MSFLPLFYDNTYHTGKLENKPIGTDCREFIEYTNQFTNQSFGKAAFPTVKYGDYEYMNRITYTDNNWKLKDHDELYGEKHEYGSTDFPAFDTEKWINPGFTMYSYTSDNKKVSIQGVPEFIDQRTIQLGMEKTENRTYTMKFDGFDLTDFEISLKDKYTGKSTPISAVKSYKFDINNDINSKASNRFSLLFNKKSTGIEDINSSKQLILYPNPAQDVINLSLLTANIQQCDFAISNQIGQLVLEGKLDFSSDQTQQLNIENLPVGMYLIHINRSPSSLYI